MTIILESELTCPECGHKTVEIMPVDACMYFFQCPQCTVVLKPMAGDCCVFCSYGSISCPPIQQDNKTGENSDYCGYGGVDARKDS